MQWRKASRRGSIGARWRDPGNEAPSSARGARRPTILTIDLTSIILTILLGGQDRALKTPELARGFPPPGRSRPLAPFLLAERGTRSPTSRLKLPFLRLATSFSDNITV